MHLGLICKDRARCCLCSRSSCHPCRSGCDIEEWRSSSLENGKIWKMRRCTIELKTSPTRLRRCIDSSCLPTGILQRQRQPSSLVASMTALPLVTVWNRYRIFMTGGFERAVLSVDCSKNICAAATGAIIELQPIREELNCGR